MSTLRDWPFPSRPGLSWRVSSFICMATSQLLCKAGLSGFMRYDTRQVLTLQYDSFSCTGFGQRVQTKGLEHLRAAVLERPLGTPLVTVCNHTSCIDDPLVWGECYCRGQVNCYWPGGWEGVGINLMLCSIDGR